MKYLKYDKYKKTGLDWLLEIPEGWETKSIKYCYTLFTGNSIANKENYSEESNTYPYISTKNINIDTNEIDYSSGIFINKEDTSFRLSKEKSVLMCIEGANAGKKIAFTKMDVCFVNKLCSLHSISHSNDNKYLFYFLQSVNFKEIFFSQMTGLIGGVSISLLKNIMIAFPTYLDQILIVRYLDQEIKRLDNLIEEKSKFIKLLKEQREALISKAVTQGLNPDAKMKTSGINYIGEIPEHWEVRRLRTLLRKSLTYGANESAEAKNDFDPRYIRITDIDSDGNLRDETYSTISLEKAKQFLLEEGDILFARSGATVGKIYRYRKEIGEAAFAGYLIKASLNKGIILSEYFELYTRASFYDQWILSMLIQSTIQNVSAEKYNNLYVVLPSINEQQEITAYLEQKLNLSKEIESEIETSIELIKERREALITAAVTGHIKITKEMINVD